MLAASPDFPNSRCFDTLNVSQAAHVRAPPSLSLFATDPHRALILFMFRDASLHGTTGPSNWLIVHRFSLLALLDTAIDAGDLSSGSIIPNPCSSTTDIQNLALDHTSHVRGHCVIEWKDFGPTIARWFSREYTIWPAVYGQRLLWKDDRAAELVV
jgi:hypothetical protein